MKLRKLTTATTSDGLRLAVETLGRGSRHLVFGHGLTGNRSHVKRQLAPLADSYRVTVFDQRGHGDSMPVREAVYYDPHRMAEDLAAVMDSQGIERAIVGGESMGAATAYLFALRWPERVEALLLTAPAFGATPNQEREKLHAMGRAILTEGMESFLTQASLRQQRDLGWPRDVVDYLAAMNRSHDPQSIGMACQTVAEWTVEEVVMASHLSIPTCIIAFRNDPLHPLPLACDMASSIPGAALEELPSVTSAFSDPQIVGRLYAAFLARLGPVRAVNGMYEASPEEVLESELAESEGS